MGNTPTQHPEIEVLEAFALGRLCAAEMGRVEGHVTRCPICERVVMAAPEDRLVQLLRRGPRSVAIPSATNSV